MPEDSSGPTYFTLSPGRLMLEQVTRKINDNLETTISNLIVNKNDNDKICLL